MGLGRVARRELLTVITVSGLVLIAGCFIGATASSATPRHSHEHAQFLVPWTTGHGNRTLGRFVVDGFIGYNLGCHGPGRRLTLHLSTAYETASVPCSRSGAFTDLGGYLPPSALRHIVVRITAAPTDHWIVEVDQESRNGSGTVSIPVGPLNRFIQRY
jgi:hypothetical protein